MALWEHMTEGERWAYTHLLERANDASRVLAQEEESLSPEEYARRDYLNHAELSAYTARLLERHAPKK